MDSESPLPAKRMRARLNGNIQLTECVREFKLPRQFPSMVTKVSSDAINDKNKLRTNFNKVTCLTKMPIHTKIVMNSEIPTPSVVRKIKLKGRDGRDLGEVNVQDLPQNIQGKTIRLATNSIKKSPEPIPQSHNSKGITMGVLTPVNGLKIDESYAVNLPSLMRINKDREEIANITNNSNKPTIIEQKQMSTAMDQDGRPQVLVIQSGKNWRVVKIADSGSALGSQNVKNIVVGKLPTVMNCGKATVPQVKEQSQNVGGKESIQNRFEKSRAISKISDANNTGMVVRRWHQCRTPDNTTERCKSKSPVDVENKDSKHNIEISRVLGPCGNESVSQTRSILRAHTMSKLPLEKAKSQSSTGHSPQKISSLRQDVMVVLPSEIPASLDNDSSLAVFTKDDQSVQTKPGDVATRKSGKHIDNTNLPTTRNLISARKGMENPVENEKEKDETSSCLNILTKALSTVEDKELRAKALKALADCGIGMERLVPICPVSEQRPVKDSDTQTSIFGVFEPDQFIYVTPKSSAVERIRPIERNAPQKIGHIIGNPHPQELSFDNLDVNWATPDTCNELSALVENYLVGNEGASEVKNIFEKPSSVSPKIISQLEEDFQTYDKYDEKGWLNIHKAVIEEDLPTVTRYLKVLRACDKNPDLPTTDGETSLELAVRYEVSPKIVKTLLEYGSQPTSSVPGHDSALIIACKKSLPILNDLIHNVTRQKSLDYYDSSGFAALHYCAQNDNKSGVIELLRASADVNLCDRRSGRTPLFHAIANENIELAQLLLNNGAQSNILDYSGHTVLALVEEGKHYGLVESLNRAGK